jgi:hypothetical protein
MDTGRPSRLPSRPTMQGSAEEVGLGVALHDLGWVWALRSLTLSRSPSATMRS